MVFFPLSQLMLKWEVGREMKRISLHMGVCQFAATQLRDTEMKKAPEGALNH